jgi:putrescine importer
MNSSSTETGAGSTAPHLRRVLTLWDLIFYGIVAITPSATATVFGLAEVLSRGHVVVTILASMMAMVLTAMSYGRMAAAYPAAGSAYTYVGRGIHPYMGFLAGWAMLLDYLLIPVFIVIYGTLNLQRAIPYMPFPVGSALFAGGITFLNLRGIRSTARVNKALLIFMFAVLAAFIVMAIRYLVLRQGIGGLFSTVPFYNPATFDLHAISGAISFAALTYLGFDAVTTLAEEVTNPRRNIMLAAVAVCIFTGLFGALIVYLAQLVWPDYNTFKNVETAFVDVSGRVGGMALFNAMAITLVVAQVGAGLTSQVGAARLLYGMGRENVIPSRIFARLHPVHNTPDLNVILLGILAYVGAQFMSFELTAELLNFGAFLGFMGVNAAVFWKFWIHSSGRRSRRFLPDVLWPALGFLFCTAIWVGLGNPAKFVGSLWLVVGFFVLTTHTKWFREPMVLLDPSVFE